MAVTDDVSMEQMKDVLLDLHAAIGEDYFVLKQQGTRPDNEQKYLDNVLRRRIRSADRRPPHEVMLANSKQLVDQDVWDRVKQKYLREDTPISRKKLSLIALMGSVEPVVPNAAPGEPEPKRVRIARASGAAACSVSEENTDEGEEIVILDDDLMDSVNDRLRTKLRKYQLEGVNFIFRALQNHKGCLLADQMGGGKTMMALSVLNALQNKVESEGRYLHALVVCRSSIVQTWVNQAGQWKTHPFIPYEGINTPLHYLFEDSVSVLVVISYSQLEVQTKKLEKLKKKLESESRTEELEKLKEKKLDIVICDKAHYIKSTITAQYRAVAVWKAEYRLLMTGTPIVNELEDLYTFVNYAKPDFLGTPNDFKTNYANNIDAGQHSDATKPVKKLAKTTEAKLRKKLNSIVIRRTNLVDLPVPKHELIIMVRMTDGQREKYTEVAHQKTTDPTNTMKYTLEMSKIGNHPDLLDGENRADLTKEAIGKSAKMNLTQKIVRDAIAIGNRIVVVSNYTSTLNILQELCKLFNWSYLRLDGDTNPSYRDNIIHLFNTEANILPLNIPAKIFLLSSKAGGCGIELTGANRLLMYDCDWSPSNDDQAMARIYRGDQAKPCFIYRLFTTCTVDEIILRRQQKKNKLYNVFGEKQKALFPLDSTKAAPVIPTTVDRLSDTHQLMKCTRCCDMYEDDAPLPGNGLASWHHTTEKEKSKLNCDIVRQIWEYDNSITFVFHKTTLGSDL